MVSVNVEIVVAADDAPTALEGCEPSFQEKYRSRTDVLSRSHVSSLILKLKGVTGMPPLSGACKGTDLDKLLKVACRRCPRCGSDRNVVFRAEPTFEACSALPKYAFDNLLLALIEPPSKSIVEFRLVNEEGYPFERCLLGFQDCLRKIDDPSGDIEHPSVTFKLRVKSLSVSLDRKCERDQARLSDILSQGLLSHSTTNSTIAILERVCAFEMEMSYGRAR
jgi:hypothetical protein